MLDVSIVSNGLKIGKRRDSIARNTCETRFRMKARKMVREQDRSLLQIVIAELIPRYTYLRCELRLVRDW